MKDRIGRYMLFLFIGLKVTALVYLLLGIAYCLND
jgi:hypothetical protein